MKEQVKKSLDQSYQELKQALLNFSMSDEFYDHQKQQLNAFKQKLTVIPELWAELNSQAQGFTQIKNKVHSKVGKEDLDFKLNWYFEKEEGLRLE